LFQTFKLSLRSTTQEVRYRLFARPIKIVRRFVQENCLNLKIYILQSVTVGSMYIVKLHKLNMSSFED